MIRKIATATSLQIVTLAIAAIDRLVLGALLLRLWGVPVFEDWSVLLAAAGLMNLLDFGLHMTFSNAYTSAYQKGQLAQFQRQVSVALFICLLMVAAGAVVLIAAAGTFSYSNELLALSRLVGFEAGFVFMCFGLVTLLQTAAAATSTIYRAQGRFSRALLIDISYNLVRLLAIAIATHRGWRPAPRGGCLFGGGGALHIGNCSVRPSDKSRRVRVYPRAPHPCRNSKHLDRGALVLRAGWDECPARQCAAARASTSRTRGWRNCAVPASPDGHQHGAPVIGFSRDLSGNRIVATVPQHIGPGAGPAADVTADPAHDGGQQRRHRCTVLVDGAVCSTLERGRASNGPSPCRHLRLRVLAQYSVLNHRDLSQLYRGRTDRGDIPTGHGGDLDLRCHRARETPRGSWRGRRPCSRRGHRMGAMYLRAASNWMGLTISQLLRVLFLSCAAGLLPTIAVGLLLPSFGDGNAILSLLMRAAVLTPVICAAIFFLGLSRADRASFWRSARQASAILAKG